MSDPIEKVVLVPRKDAFIPPRKDFGKLGNLRLDLLENKDKLKDKWINIAPEKAQKTILSGVTPSKNPKHPKPQKRAEIDLKIYDSASSSDSESSEDELSYNESSESESDELSFSESSDSENESDFELKMPKKTKKSTKPSTLVFDDPPSLRSKKENTRRNHETNHYPRIVIVKMIVVIVKMIVVIVKMIVVTVKMIVVIVKMMSQRLPEIFH